VNRSNLLLPLLSWGFLLCGCGSVGTGNSDPYRQLGAARDIVSASTEWMGGYERWRRVGEVRASAIVTTYTEDGPTYVNNQQQRIYIHAGKLVARAETGTGSWKAVVRDRGRYSLRGKGFKVDPEMKERICGPLQTLLHRVRGPLNLLRGREEVRSVERTRLGGEDVVKVTAHTDDSRTLGYYFHATSGELRFVTEDARSPDEKGTVTAYTYMMLGNGMTFPRRIRVAEMGENVVIGRAPILEAEFSEVEVR
jgi:hypothetical protein